MASCQSAGRLTENGQLIPTEHCQDALIVLNIDGASHEPRRNLGLDINALSGTYRIRSSRMCFREEGMSTRDMGCSDLIGKTKKHLRSVLISEKGGVALDRLSGDYRELVSSLPWLCVFS